MTALLQPPPAPPPNRRRSSAGAAAVLALVGGLAIATAILGALAGQQASNPCAAASTPGSAAPVAAAGQTLSGSVSWFGGPDDHSTGPTTADGKSVTNPGIAVDDTTTLNGYWRVRFPNGRVAVLQQTDVGPAPWTGRVLDVLYSALPYLGYSEHSFPTGATVSASYLGASPALARSAIGAATTKPDASAAACGSPLSGDRSVSALTAAANLLASMHVPYSYGGGHSVTPAAPTLGLAGAGPVGLDCSSSVSFVLQHAGFNVPTMTSGQLMSWGDAGPGRSVTIYANSWHTFMEIDGRYFGTSGFGHPAAGTGPAWFTSEPGPQYLALFTARHPPGL